MKTHLVLDNGAGYVKAGLVSNLSKKSEIPVPLVVTNALARPGSNATSGRIGTSRRPSGMLVAAEIDAAPDFTGMAFRRAHDRGYVARWDVERDVWSSVFSEDMGLGLVAFAETSLLVTEPVASPSHMRRAMDDLVFETFGFMEYAAVPPARLSAAAPSVANGHTQLEDPLTLATALVLDSGFSFTHAVPVVDGIEIAEATRRLNLGGKALTNHLKEVVSFRSWNMMDETAVINAVKERTCFVAQNFPAELRSSKDKHNSPIRRQYILPDFSRGGVDPRGHILREGEEMDGSEQILVMNNERISIPEMLFHPIDVGLHQAGVAEIIWQAVEACPVEFRPSLYSNIILTGGNCCLPGFCDRLKSELRPLVSDYYTVAVKLHEKPMLAAYYGGVHAVRTDGSVPLRFVSKAEYEEHGSRITTSRFSSRAIDS